MILRTDFSRNRRLVTLPQQATIFADYPAVLEQHLETRARGGRPAAPSTPVEFPGAVEEQVGPRPNPKSVRGVCPECGDVLISVIHDLGEQGFVVVWECWAAQNGGADCEYRRVL